MTDTGFVHLSWNALGGTTYTVNLSTDGGLTSVPIASGLTSTYYDVSGLERGKLYALSVSAACGTWESHTDWSPVTLIDPNVKYRALLIGEVSFKGTQYAARNYGDVELLSNALSTANTLNGSHYSVVRRKDLSSTQILDAIHDTFLDADENDVSLFFIATHGDVTDMGRDAGYLSTVDANGNEGYIDLYVLADALSQVKGKVIVWLGSCGSGAAIYEQGVPQNGDEDFALAVTETFAAFDSVVEVPVYAPNEFAMGDAETFDTGEFRQDGKFYVLTAARYHQMSWGTGSDAYNFFVKFLTDGITPANGSMPADANNDGLVTQNELFLYIKGREEDKENFVYQDVQAYPLNSNYILFAS